MPKAKKKRRRQRRIDGRLRPEIIFGLVAAIGTPIDLFTETLSEALSVRGYRSETVPLSYFARGIRMETAPPPEGAAEYERLDSLIKLNNELREKTGRGDILARFAAASIGAKRSGPTAAIRDTAFILRQLKHPHEVQLLREIYGERFYLIGLYCGRDERENTLHVHGKMKLEQAQELIERDQYEPPKFGQKFRDTFHRADVFVPFSQSSDVQERQRKQVERFLALVFDEDLLTPTRDEYGMFMAFAASLRSAQRSRQVGASILSDRGEVLSVGTNEVPKFGGGEYWEGDDPDQRDHKRGEDSSEKMRNSILNEVFQVLRPEWNSLSESDRSKIVADTREKLESADARIMKLTEFGRAVHAEMAAIVGAARVGMSVSGATLYTTTFPCHVCAKHIIDAGLKRVVYIEPYPKSLAGELHEDSLSIDEFAGAGKIACEPFLGIAPRRYVDFYSMTTREGLLKISGERSGSAQEGQLASEVAAAELSYVQRERLAAKLLQSILPSGTGGG
ncbi:MAG: anti-phage dCTP deaminase [Candidatus Binatus sp.]